MNSGSRFHIEINSIKVEEMAVRFNIFGDTLDQVTADLERVLAYVTGNVPIPSKIATGAKVTVPVSAAPKQSVAAKAGNCVGCGSDALEWITGTRKDNHKPFAAYKCKQCGKWQPEAK